MDLSKIKLVVTDMDGTLLNSNHEVSARFFKLFKELRARNILFSAASGRQYHSIINKLHTIKDDIIVIAENGGFVKHKEEEILSTLLPKAKIKEIITALSSIKNIYPVLCGKQNAYITGDSDNFKKLLSEYYSKFEIVENLKEVEDDIFKVAIYHFESSEEYIYPFVQHFEESLNVKISGENWVDISSPNAHKGYALQKVQELHDISPAETLVFGDYNNDLEMLALADFSFAMENAHQNVLNAAKYKTTSNNNFGVERVLEKVLRP